MPTLLLTDAGRPIGGVDFDADVARGDEPADVSEIAEYGFRVERVEPRTVYGLWIGDMEPEAPMGHGKETSSVFGLPHGRNAFWAEALHFNGARGRVWVRLASRPAEGREGWRERALLPVYVRPTKLSEARYERMFDDLRGLAAGLVFDLFSKMTRTMSMAEGAGVSFRPAHLELMLLERVWEELASALRDIARRPVNRLRRELRQADCWGGEPLPPRALDRLAAQGIDPRRRDIPRPFAALRERHFESHDTHEHRVVLGFLDFLEARARQCETSVAARVAGMERDRPMRERATFGPSLWETEDAPRLRMLREALERGRRIRRQIQAARAIEPLVGLRPVFDLASTPVFRHVGPYHHFRETMRRYLHSSMVLLDDGEGEETRIKSTSRLYEQWTFLQIASALQTLGLECVEREGLLQTEEGRRGFGTGVVDLGRGTRLVFEARNGRRVRVRYEPWIPPLLDARKRGEPLYRGRAGTNAWSPDISLEFLDPAGDPDYVAMLDAKYALRIREHHWEKTEKYLEIRATANDRDVVRQLWLLYPGSGEEGVTMYDPRIKWGPEGPECENDDIVQGVLGLAPELHGAAEAPDAGKLPTAVGAATRFVAGLLSFLDVPHDPPAPAPPPQPKVRPTIFVRV